MMDSNSRMRRNKRTEGSTRVTRNIRYRSLPGHTKHRFFWVFLCVYFGGYGFQWDIASNKIDRNYIRYIGLRLWSCNMVKSRVSMVDLEPCNVIYDAFGRFKGFVVFRGTHQL